MVLVAVMKEVVVFVDEILGMLLGIFHIAISDAGPSVDDEGIDGFGGGNILGCLVIWGPRVRSQEGDGS